MCLTLILLNQLLSYLFKPLKLIAFLNSFNDILDNIEEEEVVAEEEEKEAMALQQRMISHLDQQDFDYLDLEVGMPLLAHICMHSIFHCKARPVFLHLFCSSFKDSSFIEKILKKKIF